MKKQINVVGAVFVRNGMVFAAQRGSRMSLPGMWEFPGGKIEAGETPQEALKRELEEELLCGAEIGELVESTTHEYEFGVVTLTTFYSTFVNGEPQLTEHSDIRWVPVSELGGLNWAPADIPAVNRLMQDLAA